MTKKNCAAAIRKFCTKGSQAQRRAMMFPFQGPSTAALPMFKQDLAAFLLTRGPHAFLGHSWKGCSQQYAFPPQLNLVSTGLAGMAVCLQPQRHCVPNAGADRCFAKQDYGEPTDTLCKETAAGSGIFKVKNIYKPSPPSSRCVCEFLKQSPAVDPQVYPAASSSASGRRQRCTRIPAVNSLSKSLQFIRKEFHL